MLGTPQGESRGFGLADVSLAVGAIHRLRTTLRFDPVPDETVETGIGEIDKVRDIITSLNGSIARIVRIERDQNRQRADALQENPRSEERRGGQEGGRMCQSRGARA